MDTSLGGTPYIIIRHKRTPGINRHPFERNIKLEQEDIRNVTATHRHGPADRAHPT